MIGAVLARRATRATFEAMNRKDLATFAQGLADDAVFEFPGKSRVSGRFEGKPRIVEWFRTWWEQVDSLRFTLRHVAVENIWAIGGTNALTAEWELVERDRDGRSYRLQGVTAIEVKGGKLVRARDYIFDPDPLVEVWGKAESEQQPEATPVPQPA